MALDAGTNCLTMGEDALRQMLSQMAQFRTFVGAGDAAEAMESIYTNEVPLPSDRDSDHWSSEAWQGLFPCAIISPPNDGEWIEFAQMAMDNQVQLQVTQIAYGIRFESFVDSEADVQQQVRKFLNRAGDVLEALVSRSGLNSDEFALTFLGNAELYKYDFPRRQNMGHVIGMTFDVRREVEQP